MANDKEYDVDNPYAKDAPNMKMNLVHQKVTYSDSFFNDYVFFLKNNHTLLSICLQHPQSPWTCFNRSLFLLTSLNLAFFLSAIFEQILFGPDGEYPGAVDDIYVFLIIGFISAVSDTYMEHLSVCPCLEKKKRVPWICKVCCHCCGSVLMIVNLWVSGFLFITALLVVRFYNDGEFGDAGKQRLADVSLAFIISKGFGFLEEIPVGLLKYSVKRFNEASKRKIAVEDSETAVETTV